MATKQQSAVNAAQQEYEYARDLAVDAAAKADEAERLARSLREHARTMADKQNAALRFLEQTKRDWPAEYVR